MECVLQAAQFRGKPENVVAFFDGVAEEVREVMASWVYVNLITLWAAQIYWKSVQRTNSMRLFDTRLLH